MAGTGPGQFMRCSAASPKSFWLWLFSAVIRCDLSAAFHSNWPLAHYTSKHQPVAGFCFPRSWFLSGGISSGISSGTWSNPISQPTLLSSRVLFSNCFDWADQPIAPRFTAGPSPMTARSSGDQQWQLFLGCRTA